MGNNVAISTPEGRGLQGAMENASKDVKLSPTDIDYVNAYTLNFNRGTHPKWRLKSHISITSKNESF